MLSIQIHPFLGFWVYRVYDIFQNIIHNRTPKFATLNSTFQECVKTGHNTRSILMYRFQGFPYFATITLSFPHKQKLIFSFLLANILDTFYLLQSIAEVFRLQQNRCRHAAGTELCETRNYLLNVQVLLSHSTEILGEIHVVRPHVDDEQRSYQFELSLCFQRIVLQIMA